ncbi:hypothetical protein [Lentzea sp. NBRC 102530]|uniref:hypothetical protein n=1 Tax=Lentzea sp. NBRC 102530 TaxID=3032201 RepID=UPI00255515C6|nr:hypothetical protein [Lentzea sp. NBRC 102530]
MLQLKTASIAVAAVSTLVLALIAAALSLPVWIFYAALAVLVAGAFLLISKVVYAGEYFAKFHLSRRQAVRVWLLGAVLAHVTWLVMWVQAPDLRWWCAGGLLVLAFGEYVLTDVVHWLLTRPVKTTTLSTRGDADAQTVSALVTFKKALSLSGFDYLDVPAANVRMVSKDCMAFLVMVPPKAAQILRDEEKVEAGKKTVSPFGSDANEQIAISLRHVTGRPWRTDWVEISNVDGYAGVYQVTVTSRDVLNDVKPYYDRPVPRSIQDPIELSTCADGTRGFLPLASGHGEIIARTGRGKSNLLTRIAADVTLCVEDGGEAVFWACGRGKQYETWGQFLHKYLGTGQRMPIWAVNGQQDTVHMLYTVWLIIQYRQSVPLDQRGRRPMIIVALDEAADVLQDTSVGVYIGNRFHTASALWYRCSQRGLSAGVRLVRVGHRGTNGQAGDRGGDIKSQSAWSIALGSGDKDDIGRVTGNHKLKALKTPGELYLRLGEEDYRRQKADYLQEFGKATAPKTDGTPIPEIGWARRDFVIDLEPGAEVAAGPFYANRFQHVTPQFVDYMRLDADQFDELAAGPGPSGVTSIKQTAYESAKAKLSAALGLAASSSTPAVLTSTSSAPVTTSVPAVVTVMERQDEPTWADRVERLIFAAETGLTSSEIISRLQKTGELGGNPGVVRNALTTLRNSGRIDQPGGRGKPYTRPQVAA